ARAAAIGEQVNHSVRRAYALARGLLPAWLDEEKLGTALSGLEHRYQSQTDGRIRFSVQNEVQAKDAQQAHHVYRIAQEALNNALVHARASDIELSWRSEGDQRVLEVRDNGKGFDPETPEKVGKSMGVTVMRTRARLIRADLQIQGRAAGGTVVRLVLAD
ncbi:MAG: ATP-binding protein, partial [Desulfohalobiaceae bacterium]|nr:ATP-binding protein [Desulfohalobiaceae bacterium]